MTLSILNSELAKFSRHSKLVPGLLLLVSGVPQPKLSNCFVSLGLLGILACNTIRIRRKGVSFCRNATLRAALVATFHDTVSYCFKSTLETMGTSVRDVVYDHLRRKGIPESEIPAQFDEVVKALNESFGGSARVIIYKTLVELYQQYSMRVDFTYQDSLRDHLSLLRERVVVDHILPRRIQREDASFEGRLPFVQSMVPSSAR
jgi:hypothetical protein